MACFFIAVSYDRKPATAYFFSLAEKLAERGHQVVVIVPQQPEKIENDKFQIIEWQSVRPTHWRDAIFLRKLIKKMRPDCIISTFAAVNVCTLTGWLSGIPHRVVWYRTMSRALETDWKMPTWKIFLYRWRKRQIYRLATHFVANSQAAADDLSDVYQMNGEKCSVLHFLVSEPRFNALPSEPKKIVCVGRLHPCKGQEVLIRAVAQLKTDFPQIAVDFIGGGREKENYEKLAKSLNVEENCRFVGSIPSVEVFRRMAAAAICVVPSTNEALGWVNLEAHSVGTPVVGSKVDGIKEIVLDGETGFLVPPTDVKGFAEKIRLLLSDESLRSEFGRQARRRFENNFSLAHIVRHADFFENLVIGKISNSTKI